MSTFDPSKIKRFEDYKIPKRPMNNLKKSIWLLIFMGILAGSIDSPDYRPPQRSRTQPRRGGGRRRRRDDKASGDESHYATEMEGLGIDPIKPFFQVVDRLGVV